MAEGRNETAFDWKIRFADIVRIGVLAIGLVMAYARLDARVSNVEQAVKEHIASQNELTAKALALLERLEMTLEHFPPHAHTKKGEVIYPADKNGGGVK